MTKQEAIKVAEEKYQLPKKQDYEDTTEDSLCYVMDVQTQQHKRQAFVEGVLYALNINNI